MEFRDLVNLATASTLMAVAIGIGFVYVMPVWDKAARRRLGPLADRFEALGYSSGSVRDAMRLWSIAMAATPFIFWRILHMPPIAAMATGGLFVVPRLLGAYLIKRQETLLRDQLVTASLGLSNAAKAGLNLRDGLALIGGEIPLPLSKEIKRIVADHDHGRPLVETIEAVQDRLAIKPFTLFSVAIRVAIDRGGRLDESLRRISRSLLENQRLERKMDADTSNGRSAALLMGCFPVMFIALFHLLDPNATAMLFTTLTGQIVISIVAVLTYIGGRWAAKILEIDA